MTRTKIRCALTVLLAAAVTGCTSVELEQKVFPLFAAVKADGDSYQLLFAPSEPQKEMDYNHLKVMVFEEAFLQSEEAYEQMLNSVQEEDTYPRNVYVCVTEDVEALMKAGDFLDGELGGYLEELLEKEASEEVKKLPTIGKLIDEKENRQKIYELPYLVVEGASVIWNGTYRIRYSVPEGAMSEGALQEDALPEDALPEDALPEDALQGEALRGETLQEEALQQGIAGKILRFHVRANSNSEEDQAVKLKVRDAVGALMEEKLKNADSLTESEQIVRDNLEEIRLTAEETLRSEGYTYGAKAALAAVEFPEKSYGAFTFPAGTYEALQLELGEGSGQNWWCVLYPNFCFRGSVYEVSDETAAGELREILTPEEYATVFDSGRFEIRLKFLEYFRKNS